jgi:hypothetical protein
MRSRRKPGELAPRHGRVVTRSGQSERERKRVMRKEAVMRLPASEVDLFYKLHPALLFYAKQQLGLARHVTTLAQLMAMPEEERYALRSALYEHVHVIDAFIQENPQHFSADELGIVESWKHFVHGQFYVFRHLKPYTVFLDAASPPKAYGVLALHDDFTDVFPHVPIMIDTVLLPFKTHITYDGQCRYYNIFFGGGIRRGLHESYQLAKAQYGIITTLPCADTQTPPSDAEQLKFYLRNERHRALYGEEIGALVHQSRVLETLYHQEMGKVHARTYGKQLRDMGLGGRWFAILEGLTIASGVNRGELDQAVKRIVPQTQQPFVYTFQVKEPMQRPRARRSETT